MSGGQDIGFFDVGGEVPDIKIENGDLAAGDGLEAALLISLFSDRRVTSEEAPLGETDLKGWWGDEFSDVGGDLIGSRIWVVLRKGKVLPATAAEFKDALQEATKWLLDAGIASSIICSAEIIELGRILGHVEITKPSGDSVLYGFLWDGQKLKLVKD